MWRPNGSAHVAFGGILDAVWQARGMVLTPTFAVGHLHVKGRQCPHENVGIPQVRVPLNRDQ